MLTHMRSTLEKLIDKETKEHRCLECIPRNPREKVDEYADFTPHWRRNIVHLSGPDQIRLLLKHWYGGWKQVIEHEKELAHIHRREEDNYDLLRYKILQDFEKRNNIKFIINNDKVESYLCLST